MPKWKALLLCLLAGCGNYTDCEKLAEIVRSGGPEKLETHEEKLAAVFNYNSTTKPSYAEAYSYCVKNLN